MLDFSIHDALRAGFDRVVLVIQSAMRDVFEQGVVSRWRSRIPIELVHQDLEMLPGGMAPPPSRRKPWGTGQAVLAAAPAIHGPFAVVNGDDFYGRAAYEALAAFLGTTLGSARPDDHVAIGFPLAETLSVAGSVNRALLELTADGWLSRIEEVVGIEARGRDGYVHVNGQSRRIPGDTLVSMNMWGFTPHILPSIAEAFASFLQRHVDDEKAEFLLPTHVQELISLNRARVRVLPGTGPWCGITHPEDRAHVARALRAHAERGEYPSPVWR
jgi:NDP-sugar pyrophosphorylase family protein